MNEDSKETTWGFPIPLPSLLALVAIVSSFIFKDFRLTTARPTAGQSLELSSSGEQQFESRLWQDPFGIWPREKTNLPTHRPWLARLTDQIKSKSEEGVLILPVMLPGGFYAEGKETRIRSRYAILSGLGISGYVPEDPEHLGLVQTSWPTAETIEKCWTNLTAVEHILETNAVCSTSEVHRKSFGINIAFEWLRRRTFAPVNQSSTNDINRVLVLWLDDEWFGSKPLYRLAQVVRTIQEDLAQAEPPPKHPRFVFIGPRSSGTLRAMLPQEFGERPIYPYPNDEVRDDMRSVFKDAVLISATSSAIDEVLFAAPSGTAPRENVKNYFREKVDLTFINTILTDGELIGGMLSELEQRGLSPREFHNHAALISEWDTFWGRMLPLTFAAKVCATNGNLRPIIDRFRLNGTSERTNIHVFTYLRGVDGRTSSEAESEREDKAGKSGSSQAEGKVDLKLTRDVNEPEGPSQFDYINRLADQIQCVDKSLRTNESWNALRRERVRVIGIVGSDPFDALSILQALRPRFPEAVFFTTDLDARMFHPSQIAHTRNLLVCSSYGLALHPELQRGIPPFREGHQSSLFLASQIAVGNAQAPSNLPPARIFEIGRNGPFDLSPTNANSLHALTYRQTAITPFTRREGLLIVATLVCAVAVVLGTIPKLLQSVLEPRERHADLLRIREEQIENMPEFVEGLSAAAAGSDDLGKIARGVETALAQIPIGTNPAKSLKGYIRSQQARWEYRKLIDALNDAKLPGPEGGRKHAGKGNFWRVFLRRGPTGESL
jgi:hypothetical protein